MMNFYIALYLLIYQYALLQNPQGKLLFVHNMVIYINVQGKLHYTRAVAQRPSQKKFLHKMKRIKVRGRHILEDSLHCFKQGVPVSKRLRVTLIGEPAVDAGVPLREYFHLLLGEISRDNTGDENARVPLHNVPALTKQTFKYVGCMLGASLVNGGPAPNFFANAVADYITFGIEKVKAKVEEVSEAVLKQKLIKVSRIEHKWFLHVIYLFFLKASECF